MFEAFPDLFKKLIRFVQAKLIKQKSEIRLGLVFRPFNLEKKKRLQDRIKKLIQSQNGLNERIGSNYTSSVSLLFADEEEELDFGKPLVVKS